MRSASSLETMAVDDIAMMPPSAIAASNGRSSSQATSAVSAMVTTTCAPPKPNTVVRIVIRRGRLNSRPIENIRNTTPNSAR